MNKYEKLYRNALSTNLSIEDTEVLLELKERATPKEMVNKDYNEELGNCPKCGCLCPSDWSFCPNDNCGQALDWD